MWRSLLKTILLLPVVLVAWHTLVRIVRRFYKFPIPQFLANLIDNPLRRRIQPPDATAIRHGIEPGMTVLDVGPGNGRYSIAAARCVGPTGCLHAIDIEPKMIERVQARAAAEGVTNIQARVASAYELPYPAAFFDTIYLITVTGEIPDPVRALREFRRVLKPSGTLAVSELDAYLLSRLQLQPGRLHCVRRFRAAQRLWRPRSHLMSLGLRGRPPPTRSRPCRWTPGAAAPFSRDLGRHRNGRRPAQTAQ